MIHHRSVASVPNSGRVRIKLGWKFWPNMGPNSNNVGWNFGKVSVLLIGDDGKSTWNLANERETISTTKNSPPNFETSMPQFQKEA